ncbi:MAG: FAD-binding oxidoreductase [Alphaproteobacteria bacterium]|nr:FAD-binding oxidoreductase [Alphaproteobacteria bacterium]
MSADALSRLKQVCAHSEDPAEIAPHVEEWRGAWHGHSPLLLKPATTEEVSRILAICHETGTAIVPQGGNTGLVGGQIPLHGEVLLTTARLNCIHDVDAAGATLRAQAGAILADVRSAAADAGLMFPLSLASEGSCTIGGNLSTNAGGVNVLRYGMARDLVLGLEVVLADGRVLDLMHSVRKDNTGYDLKQLFIGAEGTLGIITAAELKLFPKPRDCVTAFVALADPAAAVTLLARLQDATGGLLTAFELIPRVGVELVLKHIPDTADPLSRPSPWYALIEGPLTEEMLSGLDGVVASSEAQRRALWRLRESLSEAQKREGLSLKHDIAVPVADLPAFVAEAVTAVQALAPGARPVSFGHLGDGNLHFNFQVRDLSQRDAVARLVHDIVQRYRGSFSAEHGIGALKREELVRYKSPVEIELMRALKRTLDPKNILNPGKIVAPLP